MHNLASIDDSSSYSFTALKGIQSQRASLADSDLSLLCFFSNRFRGKFMQNADITIAGLQVDGRRSSDCGISLRLAL
jgi:hypothetical protein